ncbi:hypothetical protein [Enterobacter hormaechei]|uniref:hypothetical protein n=1 Tax=Enterobacter hormaechei TaxID=158836 RepID=UPI003F436371
MALTVIKDGFHMVKVNMTVYSGGASLNNYREQAILALTGIGYDDTNEKNIQAAMKLLLNGKNVTRKNMKNNAIEDARSANINAMAIINERINSNYYEPKKIINHVDPIETS